MVMDMQVDTVKGFGWRHSGELGWGPGGRRFDGGEEHVN